MRQKYTLTEEQHTRLLEAGRSVPYMIVGGMAPRSPQQNANDAWAELGRELGFDYMSVQPDGEDSHYFTAVPTTK